MFIAIYQLLRNQNIQIYSLGDLVNKFQLSPATSEAPVNLSHSAKVASSSVQNIAMVKSAMVKLSLEYIPASLSHQQTI